MLYAIISDLHANRQAVNSVLADIDAVHADAVICLGDVVGYGPAPAEVLQRVYSRVDYILLGNHDAVVGGRFDAECFNPDARRIIEWSMARLDSKARKFLGDLPAVLEGDGFRCTHAELSMPLQYSYILEPQDAFPSWRVCDEPLIFVGHSHDPAIFLTGRSGRAYRLDPQDFSLEPKKRYIVNVGSVGQPRDGDTRASYCLFDSTTGTVRFRRIPFDVDAYRDDCVQRNLPGDPSYFLQLAENHARRPVRDVIDFTPLSREVAEKQGEATVAQLKQAETRVRRWRLLGLAACLLMVLAVAVAVAAYFQFRPDQVEIIGGGSGRRTVLDRGNYDLAVPIAPAVYRAAAVDTPVDGWIIEVPRSGTVVVESVRFDDVSGLEQPSGFTVTSADSEPFKLVSAPFSVSAGTRLAVQGAFRTRQWQTGVIEMLLVFSDEHGTEKVLLVKEPPGLAAVSGDWSRRSSKTMAKSERLERSGSVRYVLRGQFQGTIDIADCHIVVKAD